MLYKSLITITIRIEGINVVIIMYTVENIRNIAINNKGVTINTSHISGCIIVIIRKKNFS